MEDRCRGVLSTLAWFVLAGFSGLFFSMNAPFSPSSPLPIYRPITSRQYLLMEARADSIGQAHLLRLAELAKAAAAAAELAAKEAATEEATSEAASIDALSFLFPVAEHDQEHIISVWGDPRGRGRRHEGIDIQAPRGTPVVASLAGRVEIVKNNGIGGKQVWLLADNGLYLYYCHLDEWRVKVGQAVQAGDVLGTVGNTGNARRTLPHLHFGVYRNDRRTAVDPLPFVSRVSPVINREAQVKSHEEHAVEDFE